MQSRFVAVASSLLLVGSAIAVMRCSGDDGKTTLVRVTNQAAGADCAAGGYQILTGVDDNTNGTLDDNEVDGTTLNCNSAAGNVAGCDLRPKGYCAGVDLRDVAFFGTSTDLTGVDFSGSDLRGAVFYGVQANGANFTGAKLDKAIMSNSGSSNISTSLRGANFTNASLKGVRTYSVTSFDNANLTGADFSDGQLTAGFSGVTAPGAKFVRTVIDGGYANSDFTGADFTDANLRPAGSGFEGSNITNANFTRANLSNMRFSRSPAGNVVTGANFSFATLLEADFTGVAAAGATWTNVYYGTATVLPTGLDVAAVGAVNLSSSNLNGKDLRFVHLGNFDFSSVNLTGANFSGNKLGLMNFSNAVLSAANFTGVRMTATFSSTDCSDAIFDDADLSGSTYAAGTVLFNAKFRRAGLRSANVGAAAAGNADFTRATLVGAKLGTIGGTGQVWTNAYIDSATTLPAGATGAISVTSGGSHAGLDLNSIKLVNTEYGAVDDFSGVNFTNAVLSNVTFEAANLANANFTSAQLFGLRVRGANLTGANFTGADLRYGDLSDANLTNANLTNASLFCAGAGFDTSDISLANFTGVVWANTECPDLTISNENSPSTCEGHLIDSSNNSPWVYLQCD